MEGNPRPQLASRYSDRVEGLRSGFPSIEILIALRVGASGILLTHKAFLEAFTEVFARSIAQPGSVSGYKDATSWTPFMLGADAGTVLGGAATLFASRMGFLDHSLHEQWYSLDLVAVSPGYKEVRDYWQTRTILTVEHENGYDVETEMWKLAHWRSPLSVLVFYDFNEADRTDKIVTGDRTTRGVTQRDWLAAKLQLLTEIVRAVDEPEASRHLLLIGCKDLAGVIVWRQSVWLDRQFAPPTPFA